METIEKIYKKYKIMPNLRAHMYRVAAVASVISDNFPEKLDKNLIITACLLHDMGNIIKFNLDNFPEFLKPNGREYWNEIRKKYIEKYGNNEHEATIKIAKELNAEEKVINLLKSFIFSKSCDVGKGNDWHEKICFYSDVRVSPYEVVSIEERFIDGEKRYPNLASKEKSEKYKECIRNLEKQIFEKLKINPKQITNEKIKNEINKLQDFKLK
ncbi:HD domain-containing protein [Candidatus Pacearchaeota archaeon]|nr:HD domain-containing protein [Candidatus Pacearchaeota archaeon]MBI2057168.1 HD domain-containing protein [Candidatus Pacearchaeota archaeon]